MSPRRRQIRKAEVTRTVVRARVLGWWMQTRFAEYPQEPFMEEWFLLRRSAQKVARKREASA